ncbi:GPI ethanolamine phosphate transferase 1-like [Gossypium hirsutum]|uniref:GPI ethanolamine phosphate transferase 1 n=1 Tax=Gossypium hirsutum TaxID=3635 RepID=A0ABM2YHZ5_GOSHI|nr:GPI ethanolamine phosphate transferase 1-like [Gossypium hirsutum]
MDVDGILGNRDSKLGKSSIPRRRQWVKRRETWLVILGVVLHAVYMLSIFDIYFKTPIVHGMDLVSPRFSPPANALFFLLIDSEKWLVEFDANLAILLIETKNLLADGLRADKFFEPDLEANFRAPFLRNVIKNQGRWGVSHARPPTESRPGHVAIIAGFYEDPSAVTKGWKANPVEFDSVFNRSRHTISYGSPDIVPIFCGALPHSTWATYPTNASFLDEWSFDQFQSLLNRSNEDPKLKRLLEQDNLVVFLHLLGCDSNGHAHRPFSSIYLNNVKVVDHIAERVYNLLENYYKDNRTSYIFTADHGMSDKGVKHPRPVTAKDHSDHVLRFIDQHLHDAPTPKEWDLDGIERFGLRFVDQNVVFHVFTQKYPLCYWIMDWHSVTLFLDKLRNKAITFTVFQAFQATCVLLLYVESIEELLSARDYKAAMQLSENLEAWH